MRKLNFLTNNSEFIPTKMTLKSHKLLTGFLSLILVAGMTSPAFAAVGDVVHETDLEAIIPAAAVFCSIGLAVDDQATPRGYVNDCSGAVIQQIDLITGASLDARDFAAEIPEEPNAMAYDASRQGLWICTQEDQEGTMPIYFQDFQGTFGTMADDTVTQEFAVTVPPADSFSFHFCDGLAINLNGAGAADDRIYFSDDVHEVTEIYDVTGTHIATIDNTAIDASLVFASGVAVGGDYLYMANNGGGDVFRADLAANALQPPVVDEFASGDNRQEDMECDPITFSPTEVMWVRTTPQGGAFPNVITAYEIEPDTCGAGGGGGGGDRAIGGTVGSMSTTTLLVAGAQSNMGLWSFALVGLVGATAAIIYKTKSRKTEQ